jgi:hypothetical protein
MYKKTEKRRLYWLIDAYLMGVLSIQEFIDEFYYCYSLKLDKSVLNSHEKKIFDDLNDKINRYSDLDSTNFPDVYYDKFYIKDYITNSKLRLSKYNKKINYNPFQNKLEVRLLEKFFQKNVDALQMLQVKKTNSTFTTIISKNEDFFLVGKSYIDKSIGAKLNGEIEVGFFIHFEDGYLRKIEGYTFYEDWPEKIDSVEFFDIDEL